MKTRATRVRSRNSRSHRPAQISQTASKRCMYAFIGCNHPTPAKQRPSIRVPQCRGPVLHLLYQRVGSLCTSLSGLQGTHTCVLPLIPVYCLPRASRKLQLGITGVYRHTLTGTHTHTHRPLRRHTCRILLTGLCPIAGLHQICVQLSQGGVCQTHRVGTRQRARSLWISGCFLPWTWRERQLSPARL